MVVGLVTVCRFCSAEITVLRRDPDSRNVWDGWVDSNGSEQCRDADAQHFPALND